MANGVSAGVHSIIDSFTNGLDILSRLRDKHRRKKQNTSKDRTGDDSMRLSRSLRQGPQDIGVEYGRGIRGLGERYAHGDGTAHRSLAEILLRLNTGLVSIIAAFLDNRCNRAMVDYDSLTDLSEMSRRASLNALQQLYQRMASQHLPAQISDRNPGKTKKSSHRVPTKSAKIRGPTIARVMIEDSSKRAHLAVVRPKKKSPSSSSSNLTKVASRSSSMPATVSASRPPNVRSTSSPALTKKLLTGNIENAQPNAHSKSSPVLTKEPSTSDIKAAQSPHRRTALPASKSSSDLLPAYSKHDYTQRPHAPTTQAPPVSRRPPNAIPRKDTPTMYSIATNSTKLGEIPLHKWAVPYDFDTMSMLNKEAMQSGWPLTDLDGNAVHKPKKRFGLFRMFKRRDVVA